MKAGVGKEPSEAARGCQGNKRQKAFQVNCEAGSAVTQPRSCQDTAAYTCAHALLPPGCAPLARHLRAMAPASAPTMAYMRSTASTATGSVPASAAALMSEAFWVLGKEAAGVGSAGAH